MNKDFLPNPLKTSKKPLRPSFGRNNKGRITLWHRGGGHTRMYRDIDWSRNSACGVTVGLERDPNRSAFLARVFNPDNKRQHYILAPHGLKRGDIIRSSSRSKKKTLLGHSQRLRYITAGTVIYNLSLRPGGGGQILRSPGTFGKLLQKTDNFGMVRLKSNLIKWFHLDTVASVGVVSNVDSRYDTYVKAGQTRWLGKRPTVRGVAMNPVDHPHGGGEGKTSGGRPSVTPWGKPTHGFKTTRRKKQL